MLTKKQLRKIEEIIRKRMLRFTYEAIGESALTEAEIKQLKDAGLIRESVRHLTADGYTIGKLVSMMDRDEARSLGFDQVLRMVKKNPIPTTAVETEAMDWAANHAGQYIKGLADDMVKEVGGIVSRSAMSAIREEVKGAIKDRKTSSQLRTALFDAIDDSARDWQRVAQTEMTAAIQQGIYTEIKRNYGPDQLVYKRPSPNACKHCRRVYLKPDGTPRIFKLSDLEDNNFGKKANDWEPTVSPVHPWCQCQLMVLPEGYGFVKKRVATEAFDHAGISYKKGDVVPEDTYSGLPATLKDKVGFDFIMEFKGESETPETRKSFSESDMDHDHDECCRY